MSAMDIAKNDNFTIAMGESDAEANNRLGILMTIDSELPQYTHLLYPRVPARWEDDTSLKLQVFFHNTGKYAAVRFYAEMKGWVLREENI